jgi:hypothetical protein
MIGETIEAWFQPAGLAVATVRVVGQRLAITDHEVEPVVFGSRRFKLGQIGERAGPAGQKISDQGTARAGVDALSATLAVIGHSCEAPLPAGA